MLGFWRNIIDVKEFKEILSNDSSVVKSVVETFKQQSKDTFNDLETAISQTDSFAFERATHDLRIIGRHIASKRLVDHSLKLQQLGKAKQYAGAESELRKTQRLLDQALKELLIIQKRWK